MDVAERHGADFSPTRRHLMQLAGLLGLALIAPGARAAAPRVLDKLDLRLLAAVAETIIPATDTGGATAAGVPDFIDMMVTGWFDQAEQDNFIAGMRAFASGAITRYGKPFDQLTVDQQTEYFGGLLAEVESRPVQARPLLPSLAKGGQPRSPFVVLMKRLAVVGYYTSELGASVELSFNMMDGEYVPCAPNGPDERAGSHSGFAFSPFSAY